MVTFSSSTASIQYAIPTSDDLSEAVIDFSATGATTVIAGVSGQTIRVFRLFFIVGAATNVTIRDGATSLTGAENFAANGGQTLDHDGRPWFTTSAGNGFVLNQSGTAQISGRVYYTQG